MKRVLSALVAVTAAAGIRAASHVGFEADAFCQTVPGVSAGSQVFSPVSFELDSVAFAEAVDTLTRAHVAERLGVLSGFEPEYPPILAAVSATTNGFSFVSARGFCVPDVREADPVFRRMIQRNYGVMSCPGYPVKGAESWFRAAMDGTMEDFTVAFDAQRADRYCYYDLVDLSVAWKEPFPRNNSRSLPFVCEDGAKLKLDFMADVRIAETFETSKFTLLCLPLRGDARFYAMLPKTDVGLDDIREEISSSEIRNHLAAIRSTTNPGVVHGPTVVVIPRLEFDCRQDIGATMRAFRFPVQGLLPVVGPGQPLEIVQRVRFRLGECGADEKPLLEKPLDRQVKAAADARRVILNRPFFFFVHHVETDTLLVMGQFVGK